MPLLTDEQTDLVKDMLRVLSNSSDNRTDEGLPFRLPIIFEFLRMTPMEYLQHQRGKLIEKKKLRDMRRRDITVISALKGSQPSKPEEDASSEVSQPSHQTLRRTCDRYPWDRHMSVREKWRRDTPTQTLALIQEDNEGESESNSGREKANKVQNAAQKQHLVRHSDHRGKHPSALCPGNSDTGSKLVSYLGHLKELWLPSPTHPLVLRPGSITVENEP